jgi:carbon storage regulator
MESIRIGDEVTIDVVAIRRGQVRLRIVAPRRIPVHRLEIFEAIQAGEPRQAAPTSKADADASSTSEQPTGGLVLARTLGESLKIGQEVQVDVVQIQPNSVRLRIVAPRSITVHRMEVHQAIARGEQAPAASRSQRPSRNTDLESTAELPCLALDQPAPVE